MASVCAHGDVFTLRSAIFSYILEVLQYFSFFFLSHASRSRALFISESGPSAPRFLVRFRSAVFIGASVRRGRETFALAFAVRFVVLCCSNR